jgi:hypothetical protein
MDKKNGQNYGRMFPQDLKKYKPFTHIKTKEEFEDEDCSPEQHASYDCEGCKYGHNYERYVECCKRHSLYEPNYKKLMKLL